MATHNFLVLALFFTVFSCVVYGAPKQCLEFGEITASDGTTFHGRRNVGQCTCKAAFDQEFDARAADKWAPSCNSDGSWACQQMDYWIGNWCVDKDGNQNRKTRKRDDRNTYEPCPPCSGSNSLAEQI